MNRPESTPIMRRIAPFLIITMSGLAVGALAWYGPIAQDPGYHAFADQRRLLGIPNFWNVVSNLPFIVVGMVGLARCRALREGEGAGENRLSRITFFAAILCTGFASAHYHLRPDNWGLAWDRLAMALSFMAFLALVIGEFVGRTLGKKLLLPLCLYGLFSVGYWIATEQSGAGDLRPYVITQFLPMLIIPIIVVSWKSATIRTSDILIIGAGYGLAKVFEILDAQACHLVMVSGHSLKHLAAAFSASWLHLAGQAPHRLNGLLQHNRHGGNHEDQRYWQHK